VPLVRLSVTWVADPGQARPKMGGTENLLLNVIEGLDPSMGVFTNIAGLRPADPNLKLQLALGALTGKSLLRGAGALGKKTLGALGKFRTGVGSVAASTKAGRTLDKLIPGRSVADITKQAEEAADVSLLKEIRVDRSARDAETVARIRQRFGN